jgi:hypothetical protein
MVDRAFLLDGMNPKYQCRCVGKHIPKPLELYIHHVWPIEEGGPDVKENQVILCPTADSNVDKLWSLYEEHSGRPPWDILRNYSEYTRAIVEKGREQRRRAESISGNNLASEEDDESIPV